MDMEAVGLKPKWSAVQTKTDWEIVDEPIPGMAYVVGHFNEADAAKLAAAAPALLEAARLTLDLLADLTTDAYSKGGDKPARDALIAAIEQATA